MSDEKENIIGEIHVLIRPPTEPGGEGEWEIESSFDNTSLYWVLGKLMNMMMNDKLTTQP